MSKALEKLIIELRNIQSHVGRALSRAEAMLAAPAQAPQPEADIDPAVARERARRSCLAKRSYLTISGAGEAAAHFVKARPDTPLRVYPCTFCNGFHLTSTPLEDFTARAAAEQEGLRTGDVPTASPAREELPSATSPRTTPCRPGGEETQTGEVSSREGC